DGIRDLIVTGVQTCALPILTVTHTIANVTVTTTPTLITRQRRNFGSSRSRGAEIEYSRLLANGWSASAGYLIAEATLSSGARTRSEERRVGKECKLSGERST